KRPILPILFFVMLLGASGYAAWWTWEQPTNTEIRGQMASAEVEKKTKFFNTNMGDQASNVLKEREVFSEIKPQKSEKSKSKAQTSKVTGSGEERVDGLQRKIPIYEVLPSKTPILLSERTDKIKAVFSEANLNHLDVSREDLIAELPMTSLGDNETNLPALAFSAPQMSRVVKGYRINYIELKAGAGSSSLAIQSNILPEMDGVEWKNQHMQSYSALVGRQLSSAVEFSTGIQLTRWNQRMHYSSVREQELQQFNQLVATILLIDGTENEQYGTLRQQQTVKSTYETMQELRAFELPLNLHVELFEIGRWRLITLLTGILSLRQELHGFFYPTTAWSDAEPDLMKQELISSKSFLQMAAGLGVAYKLNTHYSIICYPQWRSGHLSLEIDEIIDFTQEGGAMALELGLRRNF
ncbi:MAG TPA: hypothetical protein VJ917_06045, partial [Saprospiraceae bacterium]|nr:hypothetical protein [Saprospiraceae bacterium]